MSIRVGTSIDALAELEEQRRFLIDSLDDLERERAAGDVDDDDYLTLHNDYTVRASAVIRAINERRALLVPKRERRWGRLAVGMLATVIAAVGVTLVLVNSTAERKGAISPTGDVPGAVELDPRIDQGMGLIGTDSAEALRLFGEVLADPSASSGDRAMANTQSGWAIYLTVVQANPQPDDETKRFLGTRATEFFDAAIAADSGRVDAFCFRAIVQFRIFTAVDTARESLDTCERGRPPQEVVPLLSSLREALDAAG